MWLKLLGALALLQPVAQGLLWALRVAGDVDFLVERTRDPGWIGWLAILLVSPPQWLPLVLVFVGLGLIYWDSKRLGIPARPAADIEAQAAFDLILSRSKWAKKVAKNWTALPRNFYETSYPACEVIEARLETAFFRELHRLLVAGQIDCWGSESLSSSNAHLVPEARIDAFKWREIEIQTQPPQAYARYVTGPRKGQLAFVGLRFSESQVRSVFPMAWFPRRKSTDRTPFERAAPAPLRRDAWLSEAIWRAFNGSWDPVTVDLSGPGIGQTESQRLFDIATKEFRQKAFDGELPVWGKKKGSDLWIEVPREFWSDHEIDYLGVALGAEAESIQARVERTNETTDAWNSFMTSRAAVDRLWR